jgi:hypothetical protein
MIMINSTSGDISQVAQQLFAHAFFNEKSLRKEHKIETPLKLALALMPTGITWGQLNALSLAVRTIGEMEEEDGDKPISKKQKAAWDKLLVERAVPPTFRQVLEAASPRLLKRRDLYALYGVLSATQEKLTTLGSVAELVVAEPVKPIKAERRPRSMRG